MLCAVTGPSMATSGGSSPPPAAIRFTHRPTPTTPISSPGPIRCSKTRRPMRWACARWDQMGWQDKPLWCIGGDGAMFDIGFQSLSRMLASGMNIKVFVLDTQVYSNTGGQASTSTYTGQNTKMSVHGKVIHGKQERRKEIAANRHDAPAHLCGSDHRRPMSTTSTRPSRCAGVRRAGRRQLLYHLPTRTRCRRQYGQRPSADGRQTPARSRCWSTIPVKETPIRQRLSLQGNPAMKDDWWTNPKTGGRRLHRFLP